MASNTIHFNLKTSLDNAGITQLKKQLTEIRNLANDIDSDLHFSLEPSELNKVISSANALEKALDEAFDVELNTVNIEKFNNVLKKSGYNIETLQKDLSNAGVMGQQAFLQATGSLMQMNTAVKRTNSLISSLATTMANTVRWGITSGLWNTILGTTQQAYGYVKNLDSSLNDIRIVTNKSAEDMEKFAVAANNAAKALGVSTGDYAEGSLIYYQQGLDDQTVKTLTDITAKTANVTGQDMAEVSEQLTAVWNGYQVANQAAEEGMQVYEEYVDKMAAVGATTASDLEELATAMSKVASAAATMGIDFDELSAQIATIVSVTRQAPESVGTALKTIYARMGDLSIEGVDEFGTSLGTVSGQLKQMGIEVLDQQGNLRDMGDVITDVAAKWDNWTEAQRQAAAIAMAGKRQYNNLIALFDNWDMYSDTLNIATNAAGTLDKQQNIALDKLSKKLEILKATSEDLYDNLFDEDTLKDLVEALTDVVQVTANAVEAIGGLNTILPMVGSIGLKVFSTQLGGGITNFLLNMRNARNEAIEMNQKMVDLKAMFGNKFDTSFANQTGPMTALQQGSKELYDFYSKMQPFMKNMTQEQMDQYNNILKMKVETSQIKVQLEEQTLALQKSNEELSKGTWGIKLFKDESLNAEAGFEGIQEDLLNMNNTLKQLENFSFPDKIALVTVQTSRLNTILKDSGNISDEFRTKIVEAFKQLRYSEVSGNDALQEIVSTIQKMVQEGSNIDQIKQKIASLTSVSENASKNMFDIQQTQQYFSQVFQGISALGRLASAIKMVQNLGNIWNNEDLSTGEKVLEIVINLTMILTMLQGTLTALGKGWTALPNVIMSIAVAMGAATVETVTLKTAFDALIKTTVTFMGITASLWGILVGGLAIIAALTLTVWGIVKAHNAEADAAKKATEQAEKAKEAHDELKQSYDNLTTSIDKYREAVESLDGLEEGTLEYKEALRLANEEALNLLSANQDLAQYMSRDSKGLITFDENGLNEIANSKDQVLAKSSFQQTSSQLKANELNQKLDIDKELENISGDNAHLVEDFRKIVEDAAKNNEIISRETLEEQLNMFKEDSENWAEEILAMNELAKEIQANTKANELLKQEMTKNYLIGQGNPEFNALDSVEQEAYAKRLAALTPDTTSQEYTDALEVARKGFDSEAHRKYEEATGYKYIKGTNSGTGVFLVNGQRTEIDDEIIFDYLARQQLLEKSNNNISTQTFESINNLGENIAEGMGGELLELINGEISELDSTKFSPEDIEKLQNQFVNNMFSGVTDEMAQDMGWKDAEAYSNAVKAAIQSYDVMAYWEAQKEKTLANLKELDSAIQSLYSRDELDEETYSKLEAKYSELSQIREKGSQEYLDLLYQIQEKEEEIAQNSLNNNLAAEWEQANEALKKYQTSDYNRPTAGVSKDNLGKNGMPTNIQISKTSFEQMYEDLDNLQKELDDVFDAKYELEIEKTDDILSDIDNIKYKAENAEKAVSFIGNGFQVSAENADELFKVFPELAYDAQVLADGTIQLNQEVAESYLSSIGIQIDADKNKTRQAIKSRIEELKNKKQTAEEQLKEVQNTAAAELNLEEILGESHAEWADYKKELDQATMEDSIANDAHITEAVINNWLEKEKAAAHYAEVAKDALSGNYDGAINKAGDWSRQNFNVLDSVDIVDTSSNISQEEVNKKAEELKAQVEEYLKNQINSYSTQIAELVAAEASLLAGIEDINEASKSTTKSGKWYKDEFDRYWEFKKYVDEVTEALEKLEKEQENLFGLELADHLRVENELLYQQADAYTKLAEEQRREAAELQEVLSATGVMFDEEGRIANYAAATTAALAEYNAVAQQYDAGFMSETAFEVYEKAYEKFKENIERYDELYYNEMKETQENLEEIVRKQRANNLQFWEIILEVKLEKKELEREWNDFLKEINEDFKAVYKDLATEISVIMKNAGTYVGDTGSLTATLEAIRDVQREIDAITSGKESGMFESLSQAQEKLKELNSELQDQATSLYDLYEAAWDAFMEGIDQSAEKFDKLMEKFELIDEELEYQKELIELLYGPEAYELIANLYTAQEANNKVQIDSLKQQADMWKNLYENAEEGSEDQQKYYDNWIEAQTNLNELVTKHINLLKDEYSNTIESIFKQLETSITGSSLDDIADEWSYLQEQSDRYLDNIEGLYSIQSLAGKINNSIAEQSSIKNQQKLQDLYDKEIGYLREKEDLTQYDLDMAEARYNVALKEIALEEARANKTSMRLVRGTDGNWSYQYTADEDNIADKQQELSDGYYKLYELSQKAYDENLENLQELNKQYLESMKEIMLNEYLSEEEKEAKLSILRQRYLSEFERLTAQNSVIRSNLATSATAVIMGEYNKDESAYEYLTKKEQELAETLKTNNITSYMELETAITTNYKNIGDKATTVIGDISGAWSSSAQIIANTWSSDNGESVKTLISNTFESCKTAADSYRVKIDELAKMVAQSFNSETGIVSSINNAQTATQNLVDETQNLVNTTQSQLGEYKNVVDMLGDAWNGVTDSIGGAVLSIQQYLQLMAQAAATPQINHNPVAGFGTPGGALGNTGTNSGGGSSTTSSPLTSKIEMYEGGALAYIGMAQDSDMAKIVAKVEKEKLVKGGTPEDAIKIFIDGKLESLNTGGYTGNWAGKDGRLAMLHQKELVLNADDTENILSAVGIMRQVMAGINSNIAAQIFGLNNLNPNSHISSNVSNTNNSNQQNVYNINASFPNADDVGSIREAILGLPNLVSQRMNNNNKK